MQNFNLTIGVEEEFQCVDSGTGELHSSFYTIEEKGKALFGERFKGELVQSMLELTTDICPTIKVVRDELVTQRTQLAHLMQQEGLSLISAGTHPTSPWNEQERTNQERYIQLETEFQDVIRARVLFGLHVHVGIESKELAIKLINQLRTWLPHLLALSSNSPFWMGRFTGIKAYRQIVWQSGVPRSSIPEVIPSLADYNHYISRLMATKCITSGKDIWWDIRPHSIYNTIEFRVCDMPATVDDSLALVALCQALVAKLLWLHMHDKSVCVLPRDYIDENKWRAVRYGLDAQVADFANERNISMRDAINDLLDFVKDVVDELGIRREMSYIHALLEDPRGTGADRQIAVYQQTKDIRKVVRFLMEQTLQGIMSGTK